MQIDIEALAQATAKRTNMIIEDKAKEVISELIREVVKEEIEKNLRLSVNSWSGRISLYYDYQEISRDSIERTE